MRRYLNRLPRFDEREPQSVSGSDMERGYIQHRDEGSGYPGESLMPMEADSHDDMRRARRPNGGKFFG